MIFAIALVNANPMINQCLSFIFQASFSVKSYIAKNLVELITIRPNGIPFKSMQTIEIDFEKEPADEYQNYNQNRENEYLFSENLSSGVCKIFPDDVRGFSSSLYLRILIEHFKELARAPIQ